MGSDQVWLEVAQVRSRFTIANEYLIPRRWSECRARRCTTDLFSIVHSCGSTVGIVVALQFFLAEEQAAFEQQTKPCRT